MNKTLTQRIILLFVFTLVTLGIRSQVTIGDGTPPQGYSVLEISTSKTKGGLRLPQLSTVERNSLATTEGDNLSYGLAIFNTTTKCYEYWNSLAWISLCNDGNDPLPCDNPTSASPGNTEQEAFVDQYIILGPVSATFAVGSTATAKYQWYSNTSNSTTGGTPMIGEQSNTLKVSHPDVRTYYYYCEVSNAVCDSEKKYAGVFKVNVRATLCVAPTVMPNTVTAITAEVKKDVLLGAVTATVSEGALSPLYQWYSNTSALTTGGTSLGVDGQKSTYIANESSAGIYHYYCVVSNAACPTEQTASGLYTVTFTCDGPLSPLTSSRPTTVTTLVNQYAVLGTVIANFPAGSTTAKANYKWYTATSLGQTSGGTEIPGATDNYYSSTKAVAAPYYYYCEVWNENCPTKDKRAIAYTHIVEAAPVNCAPPTTISSQGNQSITAQINELVTLGKVEVTAPANYTAKYQWYNGSTNQPIDGEISNTLKISHSTSGSYTYYCEVSNSTCSSASVKSATYTVNVVCNSLQSVTSSHSTTVETLTNTSATLGTVIANFLAGSPAKVKYQWYTATSSDQTTGGSIISGATANYYLAPARSTVGNYYYYCEVSYQGCENEDKLSIAYTHRVTTTPCDEPTSITSEGNKTMTVQANQQVTLGQIKVTAPANFGAKYQWFIKRPSETDFTPINNETASILNISQSILGTYEYKCQVTNATCTSNPLVYSAIYTVTVVCNGLQFVTSSHSTTVETLTNTSATLGTVIANFSAGSPAKANYQWYTATGANQTTGGSIISGATANYYLAPAQSIAGNYYYYCEVTNADCTDNKYSISYTHKVITNPVTPCDSPVTIDSQGNKNITMKIGEEVTLGAVIVTVPANFSAKYQWWVKAPSAASSVKVPATEGGLNSILKISPTAIGQYYYYCEVSNATCGSTSMTSATYSVFVEDAPPACVGPTGITPGNTTSHTIESEQLLILGPVTVTYPSGTPASSYQWFRNGTEISGQQSNTYTVKETVSTQTTFTYKCVVKNAACPDSGSKEVSFTVTVNPKAPCIVPSNVLPTATTINAMVDQLIVLGPVSATPADNLRFQWYSNSTASTTGGQPMAGELGKSLGLKLPAGTHYYYCEVYYDGCTEKAKSGLFTVIVGNHPGDLDLGSGNLWGGSCFDINQSNFDEVSSESNAKHEAICGTQTSRTATMTNFATLAPVTYTFRAPGTGTINNFRFVVEDDPRVTTIEYYDYSASGTLGNNQIVSLTIKYKTTLNSVEGGIYGRDKNNAARVTIYAVYNDGTKDVSIPMVVSIQDCSCCPGGKIVKNAGYVQISEIPDNQLVGTSKFPTALEPHFQPTGRDLCWYGWDSRTITYQANNYTNPTTNRTSLYTGKALCENLTGWRLPNAFEMLKSRQDLIYVSNYISGYDGSDLVAAEIASRSAYGTYMWCLYDTYYLTSTLVGEDKYLIAFPSVYNGDPLGTQVRTIIYNKSTVSAGRARCVRSL
ncbi:hypothetical protein JGH11_10450 [Dysgonomonas sp. Marseille-P4677]|uniref:hypothetical protein n=1 Tax=Dysgonomonas sp. Marseille-P4677 TaxID=2364790 RepID=UPI001911FB8F|nr:hypothetical protein [Dysgonomonas sp. Marseille-P4677]MBK5721291.1 hypothetical protein [Dysgonomonas sp. Marseille-P4677]